MYLHGNVYRYIPVLIVDGKRRNGKPIVLGQKSDLGGALRAYAKIVARPTSVTTLGEAMTVYEHGPEFAELKPSTQQDYRYILGNLRAAFGDNLPDDLTIQDLHRYGYVRGGGQRVHREISVLSNVYQMAIKAGGAEQNPCVFWQYQAGKPRTRYPSDEELEAFKAFCRKRFKDELTPLYVDLKRLVGLRMNNMLGITRRMIQDDGLHPGTSKRGRKQIFVYQDGEGGSTGLREALNAILSLPRPAASLSLFCKRDAQPYTVEGFQSNWQRRMNAYVKETGAERFWEHDIRAAAGTAVDEAGQEEARSDAQSLLGHAEAGTTNRYLRGRSAVRVLPAPRPKK